MTQSKGKARLKDRGEKSRNGFCFVVFCGVWYRLVECPCQPGLSLGSPCDVQAVQWTELMCSQLAGHPRFKAPHLISSRERYPDRGNKTEKKQGKGLFSLSWFLPIRIVWPLLVPENVSPLFVFSNLCPQLRFHLMCFLVVCGPGGNFTR